MRRGSIRQAAFVAPGCRFWHTPTIYRFYPESSMLVATRTLKCENARKPLMALILTFSKWEKGL
ncbi:MAG: hypothetical protein IIC24_11050 [Chloroflexi bacterium]|nr:hypothetical protein [Chloroflexota bacterium]